MLGNFNINLMAIWNDCDCHLQEAHNKAQQEIDTINTESQLCIQEAKDKAVLDITNIHTKLKAQQEANKVNAYDSLIKTIWSSARKQSTKQACKAKCPKLIRTSSRTSSECLVMSPSYVSETDYGEPSALMQEAMIAVDLANPTIEGNSPTLKADIPLVSVGIGPVAMLMAADMMKLMQDCMDQQSKCIDQQLDPILT